MYSLLYYDTLFFIFGSIIGSFFNVLIWRIPRGESIVFPASYCPVCKKPIKVIYNLPLLGYLLTGGKCSHCKSKISLIYPAVELATGILAVFTGRHLINGLTEISIWTLLPALVQWFWLLLMLPMSIIDIKKYIIPDQFTLPYIVLGLGLAFLPHDLHPLDSFLGIAAGGGTLLFIGKLGSIILRKEETMGGGDIKLMAAFGALFGWKLAFLSIMLGALAGSLSGIFMIILKNLKLDHKIPFGPFLAAGIFISFFFGDQILSWYINMLL
ncbi:MAG TPA: prepilin peptidase [Chitinispirillaceae bacterium]|nr:prepilin peptidase [Chitinispirillaceae bacterium]